jgi:hypothetical protein
MGASNSDPRPRLTLLVVSMQGSGDLPGGFQHAMERDWPNWREERSEIHRVALHGGSLTELETSDRLFWSLAFKEENPEAVAKSTALIAIAKPDAVALIDEDRPPAREATATRLKAARESGATQAVVYIDAEDDAPAQAILAREQDARAALMAAGFEEARTRVFRGSFHNLWRFSNGRGLRDLGEQDADDDDDTEDEFGRPYDPDELRGDERRRTIVILRSFVAALNALEPAREREEGRSWLDSLGVRFLCAECGIQVTHPLIEMAPGELRPWKLYDSRSRMPPGRFVRGDGSERHVVKGQIIVDTVDLIHFELVREASNGGCCGLYPKEGTLNLTCAAGHPIGEWWTECVFPCYVGLLADKVRAATDGDE